MSDSEHKHAGRNCVILGWIGIAVWVGVILISIVGYILEGRL